MNKLKQLIKPLVILVILLVVFSAGVYARGAYDKNQRNIAAKVASDFIVALNTDKTDDAYSMTGKTIHENPKSLLMAYLGDLKATSPKYTPADIYQKGGDVFYTQKVDGLPKNKSGQTAGTFSILLHKEGGKWKVTTVSVS